MISEYATDFGEDLRHQEEGLRHELLQAFADLSECSQNIGKLLYCYKQVTKRIVASLTTQHNRVCGDLIGGPIPSLALKEDRHIALKITGISNRYMRKATEVNIYNLLTPKRSAEASREKSERPWSGFEARMFLAADKLRGNMEPSDLQQSALRSPAGAAAVAGAARRGMGRGAIRRSGLRAPTDAAENGSAVALPFWFAPGD